jgi:hypothetical protein
VTHNTQPYEIVAGPVDVYFAETGTVFPTTHESPGSAWINVGYTEGGVNAAQPQTIVELRADQVTGPVKAIRSEEGLEIGFSLASVTLENYSIALNRAVDSGALDADGVHLDGGGFSKSVPLYRGGSQVETLAMLLRNPHLSPYGDFPLQFEVPVCFQADNPTASFTKDNKAVLQVSFHALVDPNRANDDESFGRLRAGTA